MTDRMRAELKMILQASRYRVRQYRVFDTLLDNITFVAVKDIYRLSTNGSFIFFDPTWLKKLGKRELDFAISHQLMHILLNHINREKYYLGDRYHLACDIIVNSNLELFGWQRERMDGIGRIYTSTFFPSEEGRGLSPIQALNGVPFDPALLSPGKRRTYMIDSDSYWEKHEAGGEEGVVILTPADEDIYSEYDDRDECGAYKYDAQPCYMTQPELPEVPVKRKRNGSKWDKKADSEIKRLRKLVKGDASSAADVSHARAWQYVNTSKLDWRKMLESFIQDDNHDYSFLPPDKRMCDSDLFLPDFNVPDDVVSNVLFMVDTSGSITDSMLCDVYSELCGVLQQFPGRIQGYLGFFDTKVYGINSFLSVSDLSKIVPHGGGGTDYMCVFSYIKNELTDVPVTSIVIFTDGEARFPSEEAADNVPVLWLFLKEHMEPAWGKYACVTRHQA